MNTTIIGVAGGTASGKSTLVKKLQERLKEKVSSRFVMIIIIKHMTICLSKNEQS